MPVLHRSAFALACAATALASSLAAQALPRWQLTRETAVGSSDDPAQEFSDIRGIEVSRAGNLLVLDFKAQNIRVFSPDGKLVKTIGREGQGPGEFSEPNGFIRANDGTVWVNDPGNHRYSVHRDDGTFLRNEQSALTSFGYLWSAFFDGSGRLVNSIVVRVPEATGPGAYRSMLERRSLATNTADTIAVPHCAPHDAVHRGWSGQSKGGGMSMGVPYASYASLAYAPRDLVWCAYGADYTLYRLGLVRGDTQLVIHGKAAAVPVTASERDSVVASARAAFAKIHVDPGVVVASDVPHVRPIVTGLALDDQQRLWVRLTTADPHQTRFDIYSAKGAAIGTVTIPERVSPAPGIVVRGQYLYAIVFDADDVETVVRYRIGLPPG